MAGSIQPLPHPPGREVGLFGANEHPYDPKDFRFGSFVKTGAPLKLAPVGYSHDRWTNAWGMLGNDEVGDCVPAGAGHETMTFVHSGGGAVTIERENTLSDYGAMTGWHADDPSSDRGTDPVAAAEYRRTVGMLDAAGNRHKVGAYVVLETGNWREMLQALYMFECVGFCFYVPDTAIAQFRAGHRWSYLHSTNYVGGHYVSVMARPGLSVVECLTWARRQQLTRSFYEHYNMLSLAYISEEMLRSGRSPEGFDLLALKAALDQLGS